MLLTPGFLTSKRDIRTSSSEGVFVGNNVKGTYSAQVSSFLETMVSLFASIASIVIPIVDFR